jgi:hypothetical protein
MVGVGNHLYLEILTSALSPRDKNADADVNVDISNVCIYNVGITFRYPHPHRAITICIRAVIVVVSYYPHMR